jgi:HlyD family secretion protein
MARINANGDVGTGRNKPYKVIGAVVLVVAVVLVALWLKVVRGGEQATDGLATFVAKQGPLTISVPETGTIKSREQIIIKNEVEGRTSIISLIPEGTHVEKGDLLVQLDKSTLEDAKINQEILVQNAYAALIKAQEDLEVVKNQAISDVNVAELTLEFAKQDLVQYEQGQYPKDVNEATSKIKLANEELTRAKETLKWSQELFEKKYIANTELQADRLAVERRDLDRQLAVNDLNLLQDFTYHRQLRQLKSDVQQAEMALERAQRKARADVAQAQAELKAKELEHKRQQDKLKKIEDQLDKTTITAPADGMAIYATTARRGGWRDNREPLDEGVEVFERQELIYLPTTASAMAEVDIHESHLQKVRLGLPTVITVDALPGKRFLGTLGRIAPLPDPQSMWMNPDLKVYQSEIYLEGDAPELRTGMTCKAEIIVEQYADAVHVPVWAVLRVGGVPTVYVVKDGVVQERKVEIGLDNNRMVKINSGLDEGEVVLLTPPLKSAAAEEMSQTADTQAGVSPDASDTIDERINQKLKEVNGPQAGTLPPGPAGPPQQGQEQTGAEDVQMPSAQQMQEMRKRLENMSPEQRQKEIEKMRQRFENMSPQQRQKIQERFQRTGPQQGRGPNQPAGTGQGAPSRQPGRARPRSSERNQ